MPSSYLLGHSLSLEKSVSTFPVNVIYAWKAGKKIGQVKGDKVKINQTFVFLFSSLGFCHVRLVVFQCTSVSLFVSRLSKSFYSVLFMGACYAHVSWECKRFLFFLHLNHTYLTYLKSYLHWLNPENNG